MAGFDPVGSTPVAALGGTTIVGTYYNIGTTTVVFQGFAPLITGPSPLRASQLLRETLYAGNATAKVAQVARETLYAGNATARVSQIVREVLRSGSSVATDDAMIAILW